MLKRAMMGMLAAGGVLLLLTASAPAAERPKNVYEAFRKYDVNGDGVIDLHEAIKAGLVKPPKALVKPRLPAGPVTPTKRTPSKVKPQPRRPMPHHQRMMMRKTVRGKSGTPPRRPTARKPAPSRRPHPVRRLPARPSDRLALEARFIASLNHQQRQQYLQLVDPRRRAEVQRLTGDVCMALLLRTLSPMQRSLLEEALTPEDRERVRKMEALLGRGPVGPGMMGLMMRRGPMMGRRGMRGRPPLARRFLTRHPRARMLLEKRLALRRKLASLSPERRAAILKRLRQAKPAEREKLLRQLLETKPARPKAAKPTTTKPPARKKPTKPPVRRKPSRSAK